MLDGITSLDGRLAVWIATHRYAPANDVFVWLGWIDKLGAVWMVLAAVISFRLRRRATPALATTVLTALTTLAADTVALGVKDLVHRTRPFVTHPQIHPLYAVHSSSFPSGHAATAFAGAILLSYLAPRSAPLFVALASAISFSRVYVGVHYPIDVAAGAAIGAAVGSLAVLLLWLGRRHAGWSIEHLAHRGAQVILRNG